MCLTMAEYVAMCTIMRRLTEGIRSEKCVLVRTCTHKNLLHTKYMWYRLLLLVYKPVQHATVLNTVVNCNTVVL
jgi:hypothetical protein